MKKIITLFAIMIVLIQGVFAQTVTTTISGTVINSSNSSPVTNQAVYINTDSTNYLSFIYHATVYTDLNGYYSDTLVIPSPSQLVFQISTSNCNGAMIIQDVISSTLPMISNFTVACPGNTCTANFIVTSDSSNTGFSYIFYDQSTSGLGAINSWAWDFGDGTHSNTQSPIHTYTLHGWYHVCLTISTDSGCSATYCDSLYADTTNTGNCQASFQYTESGNTVSFYGFANNVPATYSWDFADGTGSNLQNPVHQFGSLATYYVCLTITTNTGCTNTYCAAIAVGSGCPASFNAYIDTTNYLSYYFINTTSGIPNTSSYLWNFGDSTTSTLSNPTHTFPYIGTFNVCLYIIDSLGNIDCSYCYPLYADTANTSGCQAYFQYSVSGNSVAFYGIANDSINTTYSWSFGDGTGSNIQYPVHQYGSTGTYNVCLTIATGNGCTSTTCQNVTVGSNVSCSANFSLYPDSITPHLYYAVNMATGVQPITYYWSWGDGTYDTTAYPSHTYATAGFYTICLTITDANGCSSTYCDSAYLQKNGNTMITVNVIHSTSSGISNEAYSNNSFTIYPNPSNDNASIDVTLQKTTTITVNIFNVVGQETVSYRLTANGMFKIPVKAANLKDGVYSVQLITTDGLKIERKFVKIK